jgi:hypothetical protein
MALELKPFIHGQIKDSSFTNQVDPLGIKDFVHDSHLTHIFHLIAQTTVLMLKTISHCN